MMPVMVPAMSADDAFRASTIPAGLAFPALYVQAGSVVAAADLAAHLSAGRFPLGLAAKWRALFCLRIWPGPLSIFGQGRRHESDNRQRGDCVVEPMHLNFL
jgi:hypothetical protein